MSLHALLCVYYICHSSVATMYRFVQSPKLVMSGQFARFIVKMDQMPLSVKQSLTWNGIPLLPGLVDDRILQSCAREPPEPFVTHFHWEGSTYFESAR